MNNFDFEEIDSYEPLEDEEIIYECYYCNWSGKDPFIQDTSIWDSVEEMYLCPVCGELLN